MDPQHSRDLGPLEVTEMVLAFARLPKPKNIGLVMNKPPGGMSHAGRLFQARMWRDYAMRWDSPYWCEWMEKIFRTPRAECLRRARVNLYLAARLRRAFH